MLSAPESHTASVELDKAEGKEGSHNDMRLQHTWTVLHFHMLSGSELEAQTSKGEVSVGTDCCLFLLQTERESEVKLLLQIQFFSPLLFHY